MTIFNQIDIRNELKSLIDSSGHWVVIRHAVPGRVCPCVDPIGGNAQKGCNVCLSSGRAFIDRFTKARKSRPVKLTQTLDFESRTALGILSIPESIFYIEYYMKPAQTDYILEVAIDPVTNQPKTPYNVLSVYDITDARELRDISGRIEYWAVTAQRNSWSPFRLSEFAQLQASALSGSLGGSAGGGNGGGLLPGDP